MHKYLNQLYTQRLNHQKSHQLAVNKEDYERIKPKIEMIERLAEIESSIYAVFDLHKNRYLLQSKEQMEIFGIAEHEDQSIDFELHYKRIHPDDLSFVLETNNLQHQFFSKLPFHEKKNYKLVYDFRTQNADGIYVRHMHQSIPLEQDWNGKTWLTLVISHPMSERGPLRSPNNE